MLFTVNAVAYSVSRSLVGISKYVFMNCGGQKASLVGMQFLVLVLVSSALMESRCGWLF